MRPNRFLSFYSLIMLILITAFTHVRAGTSDSISISGLVKQPLTLTMNDLADLQTVKVRINEITSGREYRGAVNYRGVPLKQLFDLCTISREGAGFSKLIDLAIIIKNNEGKRIFLSWGEVGYRNPGEVVIAFSGEPVMPMKNCSDCHKSESEYRKWKDPLTRVIGFPKLIVARDFYSDRCLENVTSIEIISIGTSVKSKNAFSKEFSIIKKGNRNITINDISSFKTIPLTVKQNGDGKGFHGLKDYRGVPLLDLLNKNGAVIDANSLLLATAPDGYRSVISGGELLFSAAGKDIIIADTLDGKFIENLGKFHLVIPEDLSADRWVKSLGSIEIITPSAGAGLSIIGVGCGDTDLITLEAISAMSRADVFICTDDIKNRFSKYMADKPVLYDPLLTLPHYYQKMNPGVSTEDAKKRVERLRKDNILSIKNAVSEGKNVALLEYGDPTIYGSWTYWLYEHFRSEEINVIPGVSAFNAANAMIGKNIALSGSVIITVPNGITTNEDLVRAAAEKGDTLAIFVGLNEFNNLVPVLSKYYKGDTPVFVVYQAGYTDEGRLLKSTLSNASEAMSRDKEKFLGLIYIGTGLK